jgi:hypothetical protein
VSRDDLKQLYDTCKEVVEASELVPGKVVTYYTYNSSMEKVPNLEDGRIINNPTVASRLLPTQEGFFFGNTDYDDWYFENVQRTMAVLEEELASSTAGDYYEYWSSW